MPELPEPDLYVETADGRRVAVDDRGDPAGVAVLFFHGTPDTRIARHPDDTIPTDLGIRLIACDRPGLGSSDVDAAATPRSVADDHARILDHLDVERASVLAWSAGAIAALAFAGRHPDRVRRLTLVAPLVPADAYTDPDVLDGADDSRRLFADVLGTTSPDEAGRELAGWLVPPEMDEATARTILSDSIEAVRGVDGAGSALVAALRGTVRQGMTGLEREITSQATPLGPLLDDITGGGAIHVGAHDRITPPAMSRWLGTRLGLPVTMHEEAGHMLAINRWAELLRDASQPSVVAPSGGTGASGSIQAMDGTSDQRRSSS